MSKPIYFELIRLNELELHKIKILHIKTYNDTDNLRMLSKKIIRK